MLTDVGFDHLFERFVEEPLLMNKPPLWDELAPPSESPRMYQLGSHLWKGNPFSGPKGHFVKKGQIQWEKSHNFKTPQGVQKGFEIMGGFEMKKILGFGAVCARV